LSAVTPQHDEIIKDIGGGFSIAWDTTRVDKVKLAKMRALARERAAELGKIIDGDAATDENTNSAHASRRRRRRAHAAA
jgi:hypothetical protein